MLVLVIALAAANVVTLAAVVYLKHRPAEEAITDPAVEAALAVLPSSSARVRQLITVEILNPIELAGTRGRVLGIAGSFAPALTRRLVYDQTAKTLRAELTRRSVVADVHVHTLRPAEQAELHRPAKPDAERLEYVDELDPRADAIDPARPQPPL